MRCSYKRGTNDSKRDYEINIKQVNNMQDLKTVVTQNGEMVITTNKENEIVIINMEEYKEKNYMDGGLL